MMAALLGAVPLVSDFSAVRPELVMMPGQMVLQVGGSLCNFACVETWHQSTEAATYQVYERDRPTKTNEHRKCHSGKL